MNEEEIETREAALKRRKVNKIEDYFLPSGSTMYHIKGNSEVGGKKKYLTTKIIIFFKV